MSDEPIHRKEGRRLVMNLSSVIEKSTFVSSSWGDHGGFLHKVVVVVLVLHWMIGIVLIVSIVIDLDILRTSVRICMDAHTIFLLVSHNVVEVVVEVVVDLEVIDLVRPQLLPQL